jgi:hypothetical protein
LLEWNKNSLAFNLPESGQAIIKVYNLEGRKLIRSIQVTGKSGLNHLDITVDGIGASPVLFELEFNGQKVSKSF